MKTPRERMEGRCEIAPLNSLQEPVAAGHETPRPVSD
jgi:hypothetical protein